MTFPSRSLALVLALAALAATGACAPHPESDDVASLGLPQGADAAARKIDAATLEEVVRRLSDDALAGRGPSTDADVRTRAYIADYLDRLGLRGGERDGAWEQPISLVGLTSRMPETWSFHAGDRTSTLHWWDEYIAATGVQREQVSLDDAELVFAGYGITAPEEQWDDFKDADLKGKVLLLLNNDPDWDPELFGGERRMYYGRWTYKYESAARQGAAGAIIIHTTPSAGYPWQVVQTSWTGEQFELPAGDEPRLELRAWVTEAAARRLVRLGGFDLDALIQAAHERDFRPVPLGVTTSIAFTNAIDRDSQTANVLGLLPGNDPELSRQLVIFTAHHDHLGVGEPDASGDKIYNGARDNAAGVATVLAVAKAFAALPEPPRRSVLFLLVAAEEQGLLGSRRFAESPTVPPARIVADINFDSPTIFGRTRDVAVIGRGKSTLEDVLARAAAMQDRIVVDEPFPDKGYYYRSDQFSFARIGVPALYFKGGTDFRGRGPEWGRKMEDEWRETRYHQPSDEIYEDWNWDGMVEDARLAFMVGLSVADTDEAPRWRPGDEFEAVRKRSLARASE